MFDAPDSEIEVTCYVDDMMEVLFNYAKTGHPSDFPEVFQDQLITNRELYIGGEHPIMWKIITGAKNSILLKTKYEDRELYLLRYIAFLDKIDPPSDATFTERNNFDLILKKCYNLSYDINSTSIPFVNFSFKLEQPNFGSYASSNNSTPQCIIQDLPPTAKSYDFSKFNEYLKEYQSKGSFTISTY